MIRYALLFSLLSSVQFSYACSCVDVYTSLPDYICEMDSTGNSVLEVRLDSVIETGVFFTVENQLVGPQGPSSFFMRNGNGADCGWFVSGLAVGSRFLYFGFGWGPETSEVGSFQCGFTNSLYELSPDNSQINYITQDEENPLFADGLAWLDYPSLLDAATACLNPSTVTPVAPLSQLHLIGNPGVGQPQLGGLEQLPENAIQSISVFNGIGQLVQRANVAEITTGAPFDLRHVTAGVYFISIVDNRNRRRTLKYFRQ